MTPTLTKSPNQRSTRSTTSRRSAKRPDPFTVDHFRAYAKVAVLDNGRPFELEDFQLQIAQDIFAGYPEVWLVIPEGNGKTTFLAMLALYFGDYTPSAMIPVAASARDQAEIMYRQAEGLIARSPDLKSRFRAYDGYRRIKCHRTHGRIQVFAADDRTGDGIIPVGLALVDELHRHRDLKLYRTWRGKLDKAGAQICTISTAGEPGSEFEETRERIKAGATEIAQEGCHTRAVGDDLVLHDYAVPSPGEAEDMDVVAAANPRKAITVAKLTKKRASPTMTPQHWLRFVCNIAADEEPWISPAEWDACRGEVDMGDEAQFLGVDIGQIFDSSAVAQVALVDGKLHVKAKIWDQQPDKPIEIGQVENYVVKVAESQRVLEVAYDPTRFQRSAEVLEERGLVMVEFPQTHGRMVPASSTLYDLIREGKLVHDGDPKFRAHVLAGIATEVDSGWRISKKKSRNKIDALIALAMAADRALASSAPQPFMFTVA